MDSGELKEFRFRNGRRPCTLVVVTTDSCNGRYGGQPRKYLGVANVPAMKNAVATLEERNRLWSQEPMGVRDNAKSCHGIHA